MTPPERTMGIMKYAFIVSVLLFIVVAVKVPSSAAHPPQRAVELVIACFALANVVLGFSARPLLHRLLQANAGAASNTTPLGQWLSANIVTLAFIESCALFALVLHLVGSSSKVVGVLFVVALVALIVWSPGPPPTTVDASGISR